MASFAEQLGLDPERVTTRARFLERHGDRERERWGRLDRRRDAWREAAIGATAASAFATAVELWLLVELDEAKRVAGKASATYLDLDMPLGAVLGAVFKLDTSFTESAADWMWVTMGQRPHRWERDRVPPAALGYPNQGLTVALALLASPPTAIEYASPLARLLESIARDHGLMPFGPQGVPLGHYAHIARLLTQAIAAHRTSEHPGQWLQAFWRGVGTLDNAHAQALVAARQNTYLWDQVLASVCLVDLELVALAVAGLRVSRALDSSLPSRPAPADPAGLTFAIAEVLR